MKGFTKGKGAGKKFIPTSKKKGTLYKKDLKTPNGNEIESATFGFKNRKMAEEHLKLLKSGRIEGVHDPQREDSIKEITQSLNNEHDLEPIMGGGSDDEAYQIPNVTAIAGLEDEDIKLRYFVHTLNMPEIVGDEWEYPNEAFVGELMVIPDVSHFGEKVWDDLERESGLTREELKKGDSVYYDMIREGRAVRIGDDQKHADENVLLKELSDKASGTTSLIGFFLDKAWNGAGTTGWDTIEHIVNDGDFLGGK